MSLELEDLVYGEEYWEDKINRNNAEIVENNGDKEERIKKLEDNMRNPSWFLNGNFDVWQRGESFSLSSGGKICDMFTMVPEGGAVIDVTRITANNPDDSHILFDFTTAGGTSNFRYYFEKEIYRKFSNKTFTLAIECEASENVEAMISTFYGINSITFTKGRYYTITTERNIYTCTFTIGDLSQNTSVGMIQLLRLSSGKNINGEDFTGQIKVYRVKMEEGDKFTGFNITNYDDELKKCQRYFLKTTIGNTPFKADTNQLFLQVPTYTEMRINPTVKFLQNVYAHNLEGTTVTLLYGENESITAIKRKQNIEFIPDKIIPINIYTINESMDIGNTVSGLVTVEISAEL